MSAERAPLMREVVRESILSRMKAVINSSARMKAEEADAFVERASVRLQAERDKIRAKSK